MSIYFVHFTTEDLPKDEEGALASSREMDKYLISKLERDNVGGSVLLRRLAVVKITTRYKPYKIPEYFPIEDIDIEFDDLSASVPGLNLFLLNKDGAPRYIFEDDDVCWAYRGDKATSLFDALPFLKENYLPPSDEEPWWEDPFKAKLQELIYMLNEI